MLTISDLLFLRYVPTEASITLLLFHEVRGVRKTCLYYHGMAERRLDGSKPLKVCYCRDTDLDLSVVGAVGKTYTNKCRFLKKAGERVGWSGK